MMRLIVCLLMLSLSGQAFCQQTPPLTADELIYTHITLVEKIKEMMTYVDESIALLMVPEWGWNNEKRILMHKTFAAYRDTHVAAGVISDDHASKTEEIFKKWMLLLDEFDLHYRAQLGVLDTLPASKRERKIAAAIYNLIGWSYSLGGWDVKRRDEEAGYITLTAKRLKMAIMYGEIREDLVERAYTYTILAKTAREDLLRHPDPTTQADLRWHMYQQLKTRDNIVFEGTYGDQAAQDWHRFHFDTIRSWERAKRGLPLLQSSAALVNKPPRNLPVHALLSVSQAIAKNFLDHISFDDDFADTSGRTTEIIEAAIDFSIEASEVDLLTSGLEIPYKPEHHRKLLTAIMQSSWSEIELMTVIRTYLEATARLRP